MVIIMIRMILIFSMIGFFVSIVCILAWKIISYFPEFDKAYGGAIYLIQLIIWPGSVFFVAATGSKGIIITIYAILSNILLYAIAGSIIGIFLRK